MDWSWWYVLLLCLGVALFLFGLRYWTHRRYSRSIPLGALVLAVGTVLVTVALLLIFGDGLRYLLDNDWMDWWIFTGWTRSSFVRWTLVCLLLVIVGISAFLWRVKNHKRRYASRGSAAVAVTTP